MTSPLSVRCDRRSWLRTRWLMLVMLATGLVTGCEPVPQVVENDEVFSELDALYTAVTTRRSSLVGDCRARLKTLLDAEKLSQAGYDRLEDIIGRCDEGEWEPAAQELYAFMRAQRREQD